MACTEAYLQQVLDLYRRPPQTCIADHPICQIEELLLWNINCSVWEVGVGFERIWSRHFVRMLRIFRCSIHVRSFLQPKTLQNGCPGGEYAF